MTRDNETTLACVNHDLTSADDLLRQADAATLTTARLATLDAARRMMAALTALAALIERGKAHENPTA